MDHPTTRIERLPLADGEEHIRIAIARAGKSGTLEVQVELRKEA